MNKEKKAIIIGAGPAGLTAAYELLKHTDIKPIIFEMTGDIGGISKTVNYKGNKIDIGGHRFFSKSDRVMKWWLNILPLQKNVDDLASETIIGYQSQQRKIQLPSNGPNPQNEEKVMLLRNRISRIFHLRRFFNYPISLDSNTILNFGFFRMMTIGLSYIKAMTFPIKVEHTLEDFLINRFGRQLYYTFFKDYTEKVWGVSCDQIPADWGAQRIKGLSIKKAVLHYLQSKKRINNPGQDIHQKATETSLIERFLYPKYGPGQLWEEVAKLIVEKGGEIHLNKKVTKVIVSNQKITGVNIASTNKFEDKQIIEGDYFFSTMPVKSLIRGLSGNVPQAVAQVAKGLKYRDFITVGILLKSFKDPQTGENFADNWLYIQENDVKVGRIQVFNNWSPYMVKDKNTVWIGLEYFCNENDELWNLSEEHMKALAQKELVKLALSEPNAIIDSVVIKMPKAYPAYFGTYDQFDLIKDYTNQFPNLFLIGRNGMHKYNNQDHSMLTAITAVENIKNNRVCKENIWQVNTETTYHEEAPAQPIS